MKIIICVLAMFAIFVDSARCQPTPAVWAGPYPGGFIHRYSLGGDYMGTAGRGFTYSALEQVGNEVWAAPRMAGFIDRLSLEGDYIGSAGRGFEYSAIAVVGNEIWAAPYPAGGIDRLSLDGQFLGSAGRGFSYLSVAVVGGEVWASPSFAGFIDRLSFDGQYLGSIGRGFEYKSIVVVGDEVWAAPSPAGFIDRFDRNGQFIAITGHGVVYASLRVVCNDVWTGGQTSGFLERWSPQGTFLGNLGQGQSYRALVQIPSTYGPALVNTAPVSQAVLPGQTASFNISASGGPELTYRWRRGGGDLTDGTRIQGSQTPTLSITGVQVSDQAQYSCVVSNACGGTASLPADLSCRPIVLAQPPQREVLTAGLQLAVTVPTGAPYTFRWRQDGQNLFNIPGLYSGVTTRTLTLLADDPSLEGSYDLVLTDSCGITTSLATEVRRCFPDFTRDGNADQDDVVYLINAVSGGGNPTGIDPDFNRDGSVDQDDVAVLINVVAGGPCP